MKDCLIIQLVPTRLAPPNRPYRLTLSAPIRRANRETLLSNDGNLSGSKCTSAKTDGKDRCRKGAIANRFPTDNALSP